MHCNRRKLVFIMTKGVGLNDWYAQGMFAREFEWLSLMSAHYDIDILSYDSRLDDAVEKEVSKLRNIAVKPIPKILDSKIGNWIYSFFMCFVHFSSFRKAHIVRTNQHLGCWSVIFPKLLLGKSIIVISRSGYSLRAFRRLGETSQLKRAIYRFLVHFSESLADRIIVATESDKADLSLRKQNKTVIINNYIGDVFLNNPNNQTNNSSTFPIYGRLVPQKGILELAAYIAENSDLGHLEIVGDGDQYTAITEIAKQYSNVKLSHKMTQKEIADWISKYPICIFPSYFEGNPKTLMEMIACGLYPIYRDAPGVTSFINKHQFHGTVYSTWNELRLAVTNTRKNDGLTRLRKENFLKARKLFSCEEFIRRELEFHG